MLYSVSRYHSYFSATLQSLRSREKRYFFPFAPLTKAPRKALGIFGKRYKKERKGTPSSRPLPLEQSALIPSGVERYLPERVGGPAQTDRLENPLENRFRQRQRGQRH